MLKNKNILVTGGCGFIGSHLVEYLLSHDVQFVRVIDNLSTGKLENIKPFLEKYSNIEFIQGDLSSIDVCQKYIQKSNNFDAICHLAALGSIPRSLNDPLNSHLSNVDAFLNILITAKSVGINRIVYSSSSSVYGDDEHLPKIENNIGNPLSPYAATKLIDEIYAKVFTKCYGLECIGLRYFNVFGPRQNTDGPYAAVIPKFIKCMKSGILPVINGDGSYSRDFTPVANVVLANVLAITTTNTECYGEVFNVALGNEISVIELFDILKQKLKFDKNPIFNPTRMGDIPHSKACIDKAIKLLEYNPIVTFEEGIDLTLE